MQLPTPKVPLKLIFHDPGKPEAVRAILLDLFVEGQQMLLYHAEENMILRPAFLVNRAALLAQLCRGKIVCRASRG